MDPNEVIGTPREYEVWLAPDWSTFDEKTKSSGATRVSVRETRYRSGRVVVEVLDEKRQPIAGRVLEETVDKKQEDRFKDQQAGAQRQQDQSERKKVSVAYEGTGGDRKRRTVYESGPDLVEDAPEGAANTPAAQRTAREEAEIARNNAWAVDPAPETDKERFDRGQARIKEQGAEAARQAAAAKPAIVSTNTTEPFIVTIENGQIKSRENPNYQGPKPEKGTTLSVKGGDGKTYVVPVDANGNPGTPRDSGIPGETQKPERIQDPETKEWLERAPGETVFRPIRIEREPGTGQSPGAGLPQIIVGQSEAAIRAMDAQNAELVAAGQMTPAQRANRLQEAFQLANVAVADAGLAQRQLESGRNTGFNIANARLNHLGGGVNDALKFVMDINKNLPEGSPLGANAFVALLTMNMAIAQASGMMDLEIPDNALTPEALARRRQQRGQPAPPPPRLTDPTNRAAIEADRQAALANPVFQATDTMDADGKPRQFTPSGSAPLPPVAPTGGVAVGPAPAAGPAAAPVRPPVPVAPGAAPAVSAPALAAPPQPVMPGPTTEPGGGVPDGRQVIPQMVPRAAPDGADNVQMAPPPANDFPVMAQMQQPQQQIPSPEAAPAIDWSQSPAMLRTRAQTSVPWRLSDQEIEQMIAAGVPESDIWSIPGRSFG